MKTTTLPTLSGVALAVLIAGAAQAGTDAEPTVISLTQVPCQFVESENNIDHAYKSSKKADCVAINEKSGMKRLEEAGPMKLKPGTYIFRVTNKNVPYDLGFWVRESDYDWKNPLHKVSKTSVSGGGLKPGVTKDYKVKLEAGKDYVYSCPLNPTPNYRIMVN